MKFRLQQKSANQAITKFHVLDQEENIVGSINVRNAEVRDLLRCWSGSAQAHNKNLSVHEQPGLRTRLPAVRMSHAGILRGC